ncbi:hypothetical protein F-S17_0469 [Faustovirus]|nr:hypothetical protein F-S17_0469 [Faustovirus]
MTQYLGITFRGGNATTGAVGYGFCDSITMTDEPMHIHTDTPINTPINTPIDTPIDTPEPVISIIYEDVYYKLALQIDSARDLLAFAGACKSLRSVVALLLRRSSMEICVSNKATDNTSYTDPTNMRMQLIDGNDEYVLFSEWCDKLRDRTGNMQSLQKVQYYKNIRSMLFVNAYLTPAGKKLAISRCSCGLLTTNRILFEVAKLSVVHNPTQPAGNLSRIYRALWPAQTTSSRHLIIDCRHLCSRCMRVSTYDSPTPIALNNYAKATLSTTLHLNGSKILLRNGNWRTLIK